ncbi:hypothetical protein ACFWUZ_27635 [Streptomyces sp. NPDC058646]|uniref:hypothetical protein n=1 Tax=Streptomyces sp. NPDC058646 TaxID=3346574 RepID=UPI003655CAC0
MPKSATAKERSKKRSVYVFTALGLIAGIAAATLTNSGDSDDRSAAPAGIHQVTTASGTATIALPKPSIPGWQIPGWQIPGWQGPSADGAGSAGTPTQSV